MSTVLDRLWAKHRLYREGGRHAALVAVDDPELGGPIVVAASGGSVTLEIEGSVFDIVVAPH